MSGLWRFKAQARGYRRLLGAIAKKVREPGWPRSNPERRSSSGHGFIPDAHGFAAELAKGLTTDQVRLSVEGVVDRRMGRQETLGGGLGLAQ